MSSILGELGMWEDWQARVEANEDKFALSPLYVDQDRFSDRHYEDLADRVANLGGWPWDLTGRNRDEEFGGRVVETCLGKVTRMWLEGNIEIDFLRRNLPSLQDCSCLDIGAGYGRLAVMLRPMVRDYACVDAVPVSTRVCRKYCGRFSPSVTIWDLEDFEREKYHLEYDLAINIHSWNECTLAQVERWVGTIVAMRVPFLFTVSHGIYGSAAGAPAYEPWPWAGGKESWRPVVEKYYALVAEEPGGIVPYPHALWTLRA